MARKQLVEQWAEHRRRREDEERRQRVMVITEFDAGDAEATLHALADEILKYRRPTLTQGIRAAILPAHGNRTRLQEILLRLRRNAVDKTGTARV